MPGPDYKPDPPKPEDSLNQFCVKHCTDPLEPYGCPCWRTRKAQAERAERFDRMVAWIENTRLLWLRIIWDGQFRHFQYWGA